MGLGIALRGSTEQAGKALVAARAEAHKARELLRQHVDPIGARDKQRAAAKTTEAAQKADRKHAHWTLARSAREYHERVIEPSRKTRHAASWISSLENHIPPELWHAPIATIEPPALLSALLDVKPHERARAHKGDTLPETVQRIRQRLDAIFEDAIFHKRCASNPAAAVKRKMREATARRVRSGYRALRYGDAPALMTQVRAMAGVAARCLEFTVLTAARTGESLLAKWAEFDLEARTWTVPAERMKGKEDHIVSLSPRAVEVIESMKGVDARFRHSLMRLRAASHHAGARAIRG